MKSAARCSSYKRRLSLGGAALAGGFQAPRSPAVTSVSTKPDGCWTRPPSVTPRDRRPSDRNTRRDVWNGGGTVGGADQLVRRTRGMGGANPASLCEPRVVRGGGGGGSRIDGSRSAPCVGGEWTEISGAASACGLGGSRVHGRDEGAEGGLDAAGAPWPR